VESQGKTKTDCSWGRIFLRRMFDVFGIPLINLNRFPREKRRQYFTISFRPLSKRAVKSEIFETGLFRAIDVLIPLEKGGKAGLFGGAEWANRFANGDHP